MNPFAEKLEKLIAQPAEPDDYMGEDGLLYCGKCRTPKQFRMTQNSYFGTRPLPVPCTCIRKLREAEKLAAEKKRHINWVKELKHTCFSNSVYETQTFENDNGLCQHTSKAKIYAEHFGEMEEQNTGLLFWGAVGTGKSYLAACIANALIEKEISVKMTNFATILGDLYSKLDERNDYIKQLNKFRLLILDDFGMEHNSEYTLEQLYNVVNSRYLSRKPIIITTNLTMSQLKEPQDISHARIHSRILEMCVPVCFNGPDLRKNHTADHLEYFKNMTD